jgi:dipeptidase E
MKTLLLISNSTMAGQSYLSYTLPYIKRFFEQINFSPKQKNIVFIPYAAVTFSYDEYVDKVNKALAPLTIVVKGIHSFSNPNEAIKKADLIITGGGNTWHLVKQLQDKKLLSHIYDAVTTGTPYIGWSAGSNIACPTLRTTNDMPIVEPNSFNTLGLVDFQINPHYIDKNPEGHAGETREERIKEFITLNPEVPVVGLREGTMLYVNNDKTYLWGNKNARIFNNKEIYEIEPENELFFLNT